MSKSRHLSGCSSPIIQETTKQWLHACGFYDISGTAALAQPPSYENKHLRLLSQRASQEVRQSQFLACTYMTSHLQAKNADTLSRCYNVAWAKTPWARALSAVICLPCALSAKRAVCRWQARWIWFSTGVFLFWGRGGYHLLGELCLFVVVLFCFVVAWGLQQQKCFWDVEILLF